MEINDYEKQCEIIQTKNEEYLQLFIDDLTKQGLAPKTIRKHKINADFYINTYLLYYDPIPMENGCDTSYILDFFDNFFIRKCLWSTPYSIKTFSTSIKKFYKVMCDYGYINVEDYQSLCSLFKEELATWQKDCFQYINSDDDYEDDDIF